MVTGWEARRKQLERLKVEQQAVRDRQEYARTMSRRRNQVLGAYLPESVTPSIISGDYTHVSLDCDDTKWYWSDGHICRPSEFLAQVYNQDTKELRIVLKGDEARIIAAVMKEFLTTTGVSAPDFDAVRLHVRLYISAKRSDDSRDKQLAKAALKNFVDVVKPTFDTNAFALAVKEIYNTHTGLYVQPPPRSPQRMAASFLALANTTASSVRWFAACRSLQPTCWPRGLVPSREGT
ncbi:hypothetical protein LTR56_008296 [Elasticomyces elasticus]|nr:hypothetical protein LTR56_008296 [Elasticomyces elasticus]KAK3661433.1 hypothetical protein LTR22_007442 [Elasticomyces elasticus]KAK4926210.1 hypothetical protein LTR49_006915 [Elasticomyces elasticus]KAK5750250.1 hypothetical protein LTS12_019667 [Elasticomyces elasticus]